MTALFARTISETKAVTYRRKTKGTNVHLHATNGVDSAPFEGKTIGEERSRNSVVSGKRKRREQEGRYAASGAERGLRRYQTGIERERKSRKTYGGKGAVPAAVFAGRVGGCEKRRGRKRSFTFLNRIAQRENEIGRQQRRKISTKQSPWARN